MNWEIEGIYDNFEQVSYNRLYLPGFFIINGVDDYYLSSLGQSDIINLVTTQTIDTINSSELIGVYASRGLLHETYCRTFSVNEFLNDQWKSLADVSNKSSEILITPNLSEMGWIIRACRRNNRLDLVNQIKHRMISSIYPEKIYFDIKLPSDLVDLLEIINDNQDKYNTFTIFNDTVFFLKETVGDFLVRIINKKYNNTDINILTDTLNGLKVLEKENFMKQS